MKHKIVVAMIASVCSFSAFASTSGVAGITSSADFTVHIGTTVVPETIRVLNVQDPVLTHSTTTENSAIYAGVPGHKAFDQFCVVNSKGNGVKIVVEPKAKGGTWGSLQVGQAENSDSKVKTYAVAVAEGVKTTEDNTFQNVTYAQKNFGATAIDETSCYAGTHTKMTFAKFVTGDDAHDGFEGVATLKVLPL